MQNHDENMLRRALDRTIGEKETDTLMERLSSVEDLRAEMHIEFADVRREIGDLRTDMNARFNAIDAKFVGVDERFNAIDAKFVSIDERFNAIDAKFVSVDERFNVFGERFNEVDAKFNVIGARFNEVDSQLLAINRGITRWGATLTTGLGVAIVAGVLTAVLGV
jgi:hypothetical protein